MTFPNLDTPVDDIFMVGPAMAQKLHKLDIFSVEDLLRHYPSRYEDFRQKSKIIDLIIGQKVTITGKVIALKNIYTKNGKKIQKGIVSDDTSSIDVIWYNQPYLTNVIKTGLTINLSGNVSFSQNKYIMESPDYEINKPLNIHTGRLVPIYPETYGVSSKWLRSRIAPILRQIKPNIPELLPNEILQKYNFLPLGEALKQIHFPLTVEYANRAYERLAFDELFLIQLASLQRKKNWQTETVGHQFKIDKFKDKLQIFLSSLPFTLTTAQKRAVKDILNDLARKNPMNRLLEGEVGSGKTVVATIAMYITHLNKYTSCLMAPTEILANQHFETISTLLKPFDIKVGIYTQKQKTKQFDILVGTHALLSEKLSFKDLGLIVIDEQQRFGVEQRAALREKGINPHLLTMTATPIPRTMALTLYGELELSLIDELPRQRKKVKTWVVPPAKRTAAYEWIKMQIKKSGNQAFIICPLIEVSETLQTVKAAKAEFETLSVNIFSDLTLGLLHGRLKYKQKEDVIQKFKDKKIDILVTTPIVEVGIDIPNATVMAIEGAERFGLTQLHQLRGRVGRGVDQGYCLLFSEIENEKSQERLKALETNFIGASLAELDLSQRGPGDIYGIRQHGQMYLKIAKLSDTGTIERAKKEAQEIIKNKKLSPESPLIAALEKYTIRKVTND